MHVLYNTLIELYSFLSRLTDMCGDSQSCLCKILHTDPVQSLMSNCDLPFVQRLVSVVCTVNKWQQEVEKKWLSKNAREVSSLKNKVST